DGGPVDLHAVLAARPDLDLDQRAAAGGGHVASEDGEVRSRPNEWKGGAHPRRDERTEVVHRLKEVRLALSVWPGRRGQAGAELHPHLPVVAEVPGLQPEQVHVCRSRYPTGAGSRTGIAR